MRQYVEDGDRNQIHRMLDYLDNRHRRLKLELTQKQRDHLDSEYVNLSERGIELLRHGKGEIEDYMPTRLTDLGAIVELVNDRNWIAKVQDAERRVLLGEIVGRILQIADERMQPFIAGLRAGDSVFSGKIQSTHCA